MGRFGSLSAAYALVGFQMGKKHDNSGERRRLIDLRVGILREIRQAIETKSRRMFWHRYGTAFWIGRRISGTLQLLKVEIGLDNKPRWRHFARQYPDAQLHLIGRLNDDDRTARDFYVIPVSSSHREGGLLKLANCRGGGCVLITGATSLASYQHAEQQSEGSGDTDRRPRALMHVIVRIGRNHTNLSGSTPLHLAEPRLGFLEIRLRLVFQLR